MSKPKVIILSAFFSPFRSGAEACAEEVALRLADRFDITIITAWLRGDLPRKETLQGRLSVRRVGLGFGFDKWLYPLFAPFAVRKIVRKGVFPPVILHAILETFAGLALHFCRWIVPSAKRLLTLQTLNRSFLKRMVLRSPHAVTAISRALAGVAEELGRSDITVIPNGIAVDRFDAAIAAQARVPGRILFVGRLEPMKGVDVLLKAFARIVETPHASTALSTGGASLRIVGDGSEALRLERLARELGVMPRVTFAGAIPPEEVAGEFAAAEVFAGLSRSEALGNVFLEAQAGGCAVVATNVGGIPEIVRDGVTGLLVPPDDVPAARSAMGRLLRDERFRHLLVEQGREHARAYDWGVIAEKYAAIYGAPTDVEQAPPHA